MSFDFQLVIVGGGSGGLTAADLAAELGLTRVALVEKEENLGGECLHTGCVPSKALLHSAKLYASGNMKTDPWTHVKESIQFIQNRSDNDEHLTARGLTVLHGNAKFKDKHTLSVGNKQITSKYFLIATGSKPAIPPIEGINDVEYLTNENVFDLGKSPKSLIVIGGGPIGCELACAFSLLGVDVTLLQSSDRLLPREEPQVSELLAEQLKEQGVKLIFNADIKKVKKNEKSVAVEYSAGSVEAEKLLVATGRTPTTDLALENAQVLYDKTGVQVNKFFQTRTPNIYAIGDCTPAPKFTHLAGHQASIALRNMLFGLVKKNGSYMETVPWITYTTPEIARIGKSLDELVKENVTFDTVELEYSEIDRAVTDDTKNGFVRTYVDKKGKLLGALVVGVNASEILASLCHIFYHKQSISTLGLTVYPYPTLSSGLNLLASKYLSNKARNSSIVKLMTRQWKKS